MVDALNAVDSLDFKLSKHEAAQLIEKDWVTSDKWLKGVTPFQLDRTQDEVSNLVILVFYYVMLRIFLIL